VEILTERRPDELDISVLMAVYARENPVYLAKSLESICAQTYSCNEIVLVEDGPLPEELSNIIDSFRDRATIVSVRLPLNVGLATALNEGLRHCHCSLVARMDADDICFPERFEVQARAFDKDASLSIVGSFAIEIDESGVRGCLRRMPVSHERIVDNLWACPLIHPAVMFRRESIIGLGGYDGSLKRRQDYELWFRCAVNGLRFFNCDRPLLLYRFSRNALRKQPIGLAFQQAMVGYRGTVQLNMSLWKRLACFGPFLRSLLPTPLQYIAYRFFGYFDPRQRGRGVRT
jgi:glycosyltransferase involved in cell wall biosynthesis